MALVVENNEAQQVGLKRSFSDTIELGNLSFKINNAFYVR
jgi:hypothetical protein